MFPATFTVRVRRTGSPRSNDRPAGSQESPMDTCLAGSQGLSAGYEAGTGSTSRRISGVLTRMPDRRVLPLLVSRTELVTEISGMTSEPLCSAKMA